MLNSYVCGERVRWAGKGGFGRENLGCGVAEGDFGGLGSGDHRRVVNGTRGRWRRRAAIKVAN